MAVDNLILLRRGTGATSSTVVPSEGEPVFDTGTGKLYIGDGSAQLQALTAVNSGSASSLAADNLSAGDAAINLTTTSGNITIDAQENNSDIIFKGTDGGSDVTFLTIDGSEGGNAAFNGAIDCNTSLTIGSAVMTEADLEQLDGITAGTVAGDKAVVVDSNKDAASFRHVTLTGTLTAADLDISNDVDIDGTLEADAMTLNGTAITTTATLSTGISNNNVPKFTSGVADNDFLRVDGTAIEGRSASEVLSDIGASAAAGSSSIVTTGALDSGSITSGFGNIDNGTSTLDTGALTATTITGVGDMTVTADDVIFQNSAANDPLVQIKNTTNDTAGARLRFVKDKGAAGADNDVAGQIEFYADDDNQDNLLFAKITAQVADASNGAEGGKLSLGVATHDGEFQNGLILTDGNAEDEVDVTIGNGSSSLTTTAGDLTVTGDLTVSGTTTTVNTANMTVEDKNIVLGSGNSGSEVADATGLTFEGGTGDDVTFQYNATANMVELKHGSSYEAFKAGTITGTFVGDITGDVTGNVSGTAATVTSAAQTSITSLGTLTTLTVDNVIVNGTTIGHTDDNDLITLADGIATVAGELSVTTLDIGGTDITTTAAEINLIDGGTARGTSAVANGDGFLHNDNGTMKMTNVSSLATLLAGSGLTATNSVIAVDTLNQDTTGTAALAEGLTGTPNIACGTISGSTITATTAIALGDDDPIKFGAHTDAYIVHDAGALSADAETPDWVEGTSDHLGYAADSLVISNVTNDADIAFFVSDGGHSRGVLKLNGDDGNIYTGGGADLKGEGAATSSITGFTLDGGSF